VTWTLPDADGTNGQVLSTNGSGLLSWVTAGGGGTTFQDNTFTIQDNSDNTKQVMFDASTINTGTTRTYTFPNVNGGLITTGNLTSITTTGTITSGTWNGTTISPQYGGTGLNTSATATGSLLYTSGTGTWATRAAGTNGQVLTMSGGVPTWADPSSGGSSVAVYSSLTIDAVNNITITNTTARFHRFAFSGTTGTSTDLNITLPDPSSYPEGTSIHFICHFETTGGSSPEFILTTPSGSIYAATLGKGQTNFSIGTLLLVTFMCDGVNYYRAP
jgi:hypothetical protein